MPFVNEIYIKTTTQTNQNFVIEFFSRKFQRKNIEFTEKF
jgi:hypothetical protein